MRAPARHADPAGPLRVVHGLLAAAAGGVFLGGYMGAVTWGIDAIGAPPAVHRATGHVHAERVAAAVEVPTGGPERVGRDDGKNGAEPTTPSRACRCSVRTPPVVVALPTGTAIPAAGVVPQATRSSGTTTRTTVVTSQTKSSTTAAPSSTAVTSTNATTTAAMTTTATTAAGSTTDDPDETTAATSSEETAP